MINGTDGLSMGFSAFYYGVLKKLYSECLYTQHLYSIISILLHLLDLIFIHLYQFTSLSYFLGGRCISK